MAEPGIPEHVIETHAHETMIKPDRPPHPTGHARQHHAREPVPADQQLAPLLLTLQFAPAHQARFDKLRERHFPAERNHIPAHVTLFHALPGSALATVHQMVAEAAAATPPAAVRVTGLRFLGRGVAYELNAPEIAGVRNRLATAWRPWLTPQDAQTFRPHLTIQNKADPAEARALLTAMQAAFVPFTVDAAALLLWHYRGGPWERAGRFPLTGPA